MIHLMLHGLVPLLVAGLIYRPEWRSAVAIMLGTMLVDVDHLLADPIYDPERCSIGFHPLHGAVPIVIYAILVAAPLLKAAVGEERAATLRAIHLIGVGLLIHMGLDALDCVS